MCSISFSRIFDNFPTSCSIRVSFKNHDIIHKHHFSTEAVRQRFDDPRWLFDLLFCLQFRSYLCNYCKFHVFPFKHNIRYGFVYFGIDKKTCSLCSRVYYNYRTKWPFIIVWHDLIIVQGPFPRLWNNSWFNRCSFWPNLVQSHSSAEISCASTTIACNVDDAVVSL